MIESLVIATLFSVIGFGLGRLRFHALFRQIFRKRPPKYKNPPDCTTESDRQQNIAIWSTIYAQSTILHSSLLKYISTAAFAIMGYAATVLASGKIKLTEPFFALAACSSNSYCSTSLKSEMMSTWALIVLGLSVLWSLGSTEVLAYKQHRIADEIRASYNKNPTKFIWLPQARPPFRAFIYSTIALLLLLGGVWLLFESITLAARLPVISQCK